MKQLILLCLCLAQIQLYAGGELLDYKLVRDFSEADLQAMWKSQGIPKVVSPIKNGVQVYDITYTTHWHDGSLIKASGLYFVPKAPKQALPRLVYHHGTVVMPARDIDYNGESTICLVFAADGYAVHFPDYIGLGRGDKFHLYQHADSEGQASVDMLLAIEQLNKIIAVEVTEQLFLTGYSQGGHATMATHKMIQEQHADRWTVTASSPMSGAYHMSGPQSETMFREYTQPHYLPYLLRAFDEVYQVVDGDFYKQTFKPPYDEMVPQLFDGQHSIGQINDALPKIPKDMVRDSLVNLYLTDPNFTFKLALQANDLHDWKPEAPVQLCFCQSDEEVYYKNALSAYEHMRARGAKHVTKRSGGKKFGHFKCAGFSAMYAKMYFDSFRKGSKHGRKGPIGKRLIIWLGRSITKP
jgi:pimeloyl-ACP methyl ester carboxylesterase